MIFTGFGDILAKPVRGCEFICCVNRVEFDLHKCKRSQITLKYIKLCGQATVKRYEIACLFDESAVNLLDKMVVGFFCERKIVLLAHHKPGSLVGHIIAVI